MTQPDTLPYHVRLVVHRRDDAYRARWIEPDGQESESFDLTCGDSGEARGEASYPADLDL